MKKASLILFLASISTILFPQEFSKKVVIGVYTNIGVNQPIRFKQADDVFKFRGRGSYTMGVTFSRSVTEKIKINLGACYTVHKVAFDWTAEINTDNRMATETFDVFNIPIMFNRYFKKQYYCSFGTVIDFQFPRRPSFVDTQTGFGLSFGAGKEFSISNFILDITPNIEIHSVIPFSSVENQQRLVVFGLRIGLKNN